MPAVAALERSGGRFYTRSVQYLHRVSDMGLNPYEASEHPDGPMEAKRQLSQGYVLLEAFWIALAIAMTGYIALGYLVLPLANDHVFTAAESNIYSVAMVLAVLAFFGDLFVIPTAFGGLFGRIGMGIGAFIGTLLLVFIAQHAFFHGHF
jgi:hypothetical protein